MALMAWLLGYFFWADAVLKVQSLLDGVGWLHSLWLWLQERGVGYASEVVASMFVVLGPRRFSWCLFCCWWACSWRPC